MTDTGRVKFDMDEREYVDRREAVAGLGLMAALTVALLGAIAFRIFERAPAPRPTALPRTLATQDAGDGQQPIVGDSEASGVQQAGAVAPIESRPRFIAPGNH